MENFKDYYVILGVSRTASEDEIKKAYRNLAKEYHPDKHQGATPEEMAYYEEKFKQVHEAYEQIGNESKNDNRAQYNKKYDAYQERQERRRKAREEQFRSERTRTESSSQRQRTTSHTKTTQQEKVEEPSMRKFAQDIKQAWQEVRQEEKKQPFFKRHKTLNGKIYRNFHKKNGTTADEIIYAMKNGTLHIFAETLFQLEKLTHITEDSIPKYILRNRAVLATVLAFVILLSGAGLGKGEVPQVDGNKESYSQNTPNPNDKTYDEETYYQEDEETTIENYQIYRKYTVEQGDTLSELAEDANTTVNEIMRRNGLSSTTIFAGSTIYIPYNIDAEDLRYATVAAYYQPGTSLNDFASRYNTTADSIYTLNEEAFEDGQAISDTLLVPTFATQKEIKEQKAVKTYTYSYE